MKTAAAVARAALQALAAAVIATNSLRNPPTQTSKTLMLAAVAVIAAMAIYEPVRVARKERKEERKRVTRSKVLSALSTALVQIEDITALRASEIGLQAFSIEKKAWSREKHLVRLARLRFNDMQPPSDIEWLEGKGIVGECWRFRRYHEYDFDTHHSDQHTWTEEKWDELSPDLTMGMSWAEFEQVRGRYGIIGAFPIVHADTNRLLGVLALDGSPGNYNNLTAGPVQRVCASAAARIADLFASE
ncbi:hypothetical protein [Kitasatospora sp. NPDC001225]